MHVNKSSRSNDVGNFDLNFDTDNNEEQDTSTDLFEYSKSVCKEVKSCDDSLRLRPIKVSTQ